MTILLNGIRQDDFFLLNGILMFLGLREYLMKSVHAKLG